MKITLNSYLLKESLSRVQALVDRKNSRPLLTNYFFEAKDNLLVLIGTDLEVSGRATIQCQTEGRVQFCINGKSITDIIRELPEGEVIFEINESENLLKLSSHNINYSLLIINSDDYPEINFEHSEEKISISSKIIKKIIEKTSYAISTDETRIFLNGIFFKQTEGKLRTVAIDGHRLALLDNDIDTSSIQKLNEGIIIPRKGIYELKKMSDLNPDKDIEMSLDDSFIYFSYNNEFVLSIRLIAREYPKYKSVIPEKTAFNLTFDKDKVLQAVKRIKLLSNEKTNGIKLHFKKDYLCIEANDPSLGEAKEELPIKYEGSDISIGFNAKYLIDSLNIFDDNEVIFEFNNELSPLVIKSKNLPEYLGIIMPLKM